jgi:hypothetical protein
LRWCGWYGAAGAADADTAAAKAQVKQYQREGYTTTVSVINMSMGDRWGCTGCCGLTLTFDTWFDCTFLMLCLLLDYAWQWMARVYQGAVYGLWE